MSLLTCDRVREMLTPTIVHSRYLITNRDLRPTTKLPTHCEGRAGAESLQCNWNPAIRPATGSAHVFTLWHIMSDETVMNIKNPDELWRLQKAKLRLIFIQLHDEDFQYDYNEKDVMMTKLQEKVGKSKEELNLMLSGL